MKNNEFENQAYSIGAAHYYLQVADALNLTLAFVGAHGRAKTSFINQYGCENGYDEVISIVLSQMSPEDMVGLPITKTYNGETVTTYSCPDWLAKACDPDKKILLNFDEFNNGEDDVQASILKLIDERELLGRKLNESTMITIAFNPPEIAPNAHDLSKATRDRICVIPIQDKNRKPYKDYYSKNGMDFLSNLLDEVPEIVNDYSEEVIDCAYENAEFTFRSLEKSYKICEYIAENELPKFVATAMCRGYGGRMTGDTFVKQFYENYQNGNETRKIIEIAKNAKSGDDIFKGLKKAKISLNRDFAELSRIVGIIDANADGEAFEEFLNKNFTREFVVGYTSNKAVYGNKK